MFRSTLERGSSRNAVALAGLVLAFAALGPSAAVAKKGGSDRPIKDDSSGTLVLDVATGSFVIDATGVVSHLGKTTSHYDGVATITGTSFTLSGTAVMVAANGDKLFGTLGGSGTTDPSTGNSQGTSVVTYTGGTGRFRHASGSATGPFSTVLTSVDATKLTAAISYALTGTISYSRCRGKHRGPRHHW